MIVRLHNEIGRDGLQLLRDAGYTCDPDQREPNPLLILLRSYRGYLEVPEMVPASVIALARAGTGVDNLPLAVLSQRGVVASKHPRR